MSSSWLANHLISALLLPPLSLVLLAAAGLLLRRRWPRAGTILCAAALTALVILSTGAGARMLIAPLEAMSQPLTAPNSADAQAIVILGGGRIKQAPDYNGQDRPSLITMARLYYGAKLQRQTGLPLLVTGGKPDGASESEAALMARMLHEELNAPVRWIEQHSNNTADNARLSVELLKQAGVRRIMLVTDALHMPRAHAIFAKHGIEVVAAPTLFLNTAPLAVEDFIPKARHLANTSYALHEWIGLVWYWQRHGSDLPPADQHRQFTAAK